MANRDELKQKREADTRVALLGLAADRQGLRQGSCLSSKEMAEFLDEKCETDQQQLYLAHLSSCETCYREWLDLQQELSHGSVEQKRPLIFQRRFLTAGGSLLAAAASVVFYLNLDVTPGPQNSPVLKAPQFEMKQSPKSFEIPAQQKAAESIAEPAPVKELNPQFDAVLMESVQDSEKIEKFGMPSDQAPLRANRMTASSTVLDPAQKWIQQVQKKCEAEGRGPDVWQDLVRQGKELSSKNYLSPQLLIILEKLNQLLAGDAREAVCAEIQGILTENNYEQ